MRHHEVEGYSIEDYERATRREASTARGAYRVYARRFLMLALFCLTGLVTSMFQLSFAAIQNRMRDYFKVSSAEVNMLAMVFVVLNIPVTPLSTWAIARHGLRRSVLAGASLTAGGAWLRYIGVRFGAGNGFWTLFLGQSLVACANPFLSNSLSTLGANWFGEKERSMAVSMGGLIQMAGMGVAFVLGPFMVTHAGGVALESDLRGFTLVMALAPTGMWALCVILFRAHPPTPPSASAEAQMHGMSASFSQMMKALVGNAPFVRFVIATALTYGVVMTLMTTISQVLLPEGFSGQQTGVLGGLMLYIGIPGTFFYAYLMGRTRRYKLLLVVACSGIAGSVSLLALFMTCRSLYMAEAVITLTLVALFSAALMPLGMELGVELTYPAPASASASVVNLATSVTTIVITMIVTSLQSKTAPYRMVSAMVVAAAFAIIGAFSAAAMKESYQRQQFEHQATSDHIALTAVGYDGEDEKQS